jgi:UDPglucose 6-dehydrogenase/GDP-mannose 6-dehydrogenase
VCNSAITFIAVGTPFDGRSIDLSYVLAATRQIGEVLKTKSDYHVVVVKSTVVPGTTDRSILPALESASGKKAGIGFGLGMNPEFLSEGEAVNDFMHPDRIVLGAIDHRTIECLEEVYRPFPNAPRIRTNTRTAEMIKYASNALLANLISFSNEIANLGSALGDIDATEVMRGVRVSQYFSARKDDGTPPITAFLHPGCGFGGSCLPKDVRALVAHGRSAGQDMRLLDAVIRINDEQPTQVIQLLLKHRASLQGVRVAVLGLSFKPGTNDTRESPAFPIIRELLSREASVAAFDPAASHEARQVIDDARVAFAPDLPTALERADAVVVVTPWPEFRVVPSLLASRDPQPVFVDCRRAYDKRQFTHYEGIGT